MFVTSRKNILAILIFMMASVAARAQVISGKITDNKSHPIADAFVHVLNTNLSAITNDQGAYSFEPIQPGKYSISVSAVGYSEVNEDIVVTAANKSFDLQLNDAAVQLDAVVVTAQKKEESLQNIPLSTTAISAKQVQQYQLWNSKELTAIVPNLYSNNSGDERNVTSIRGIVTTSYDPAVATYIDGVNQFSLDTYIAAFNDIERIEVSARTAGYFIWKKCNGWRNQYYYKTTHQQY